MNLLLSLAMVTNWSTCFRNSLLCYNGYGNFIDGMLHNSFKIDVGRNDFGNGFPIKFFLFQFLSLLYYF